MKTNLSAAVPPALTDDQHIAASVHLLALLHHRQASIADAMSGVLAGRKAATRHTLLLACAGLICARNTMPEGTLTDDDIRSVLMHPETLLANKVAMRRVLRAMSLLRRMMLRHLASADSGGSAARMMS